MTREENEERLAYLKNIVLNASTQAGNVSVLRRATETGSRGTRPEPYNICRKSQGPEESCIVILPQRGRQIQDESARVEDSGHLLLRRKHRGGRSAHRESAHKTV